MQTEQATVFSFKLLARRSRRAEQREGTFDAINCFLNNSSPILNNPDSKDGWVGYAMGFSVNINTQRIVLIQIAGLGAGWQ